MPVMARIRSVKPEYFLHEGIYDAEVAARLPLRIAFIGLWTQADREGRFKWKPRALKAAILPHDRLDFERVLAALEAGKFIVRYEVDGEAFGWIPTLATHQHFHVNEKASQLPPPPIVRTKSGKSHPGASTVPAPSEHPASTPVLLALGSGLLALEKESARAHEPTDDELAALGFDEADVIEREKAVTRPEPAGSKTAEAMRQCREVRKRRTGVPLTQDDERALGKIIAEQHALGREHRVPLVLDAWHDDPRWQPKGWPLRAFAGDFGAVDAKLEAKPRATPEVPRARLGRMGPALEAMRKAREESAGTTVGGNGRTT